MNKSTIKYVDDYESAFSSKRIVVPNYNRPGLAAFNIKRILFQRIKSLLSASVSFPLEVMNNYFFYKELKKFKKSGRGKKALVVGNGPSQGLVNSELLNHFKHNGNDTFFVNYWFDNKDIGMHVPSYVVLSDPRTIFHDKSDDLYDKNQYMSDYLRSNSEIIICAPMNATNYLKKKFPSNKIIGFIDTQIPGITTNISPLFPRGFKSMTLYKALALSCFAEYDDICIIGMDNNYKLYNDHLNRVHRLDSHAGSQDKIVDMSKDRNGVAEVYEDILLIFSDLKLFDRNMHSKIVNLDKYSLTDAFKKIDVSIDSFFYGNL